MSKKEEALLKKSYIIDDPTGELFEKYGYYFEDNGYCLKRLNLNSLSAGNSYNPFCYLRSDRESLELAHMLCKGKTSERGEVLMNASISYLMRYGEDSEKCFGGAVSFLEDCDTVKNGTIKAFENVPPQSFVFKSYNAYRGIGPVAECLMALNVFDLREADNFTSNDNMNLAQIPNERSAMFITPAVIDSPLNILAEIIDAQISEHTLNPSRVYAIVSKDGIPIKAYSAEDTAKKVLLDLRGGQIVKNDEMDWWEVRTSANTLVSWRGTKKGAKKLLKSLKKGTVKEYVNEPPLEVERLTDFKRLDKFSSGLPIYHFNAVKADYINTAFTDTEMRGSIKGRPIENTSIRKNNIQRSEITDFNEEDLWDELAETVAL